MAPGALRAIQSGEYYIFEAGGDEIGPNSFQKQQTWP